MPDVAAIAAVALAAGLLVGVTGSGPPNLLLNPSFEEGAEAPAAWEQWNGKGVQFRRDTGQRRSGNASGCLDIGPVGTADYPAYSFTVRPAVPGEEYAGSVWARTEGMTELGAYLVISFFQGERRLSFVEGTFTGPGDHEWMPLRVRATVPPDTDNVKFMLCAHGQGKVWFDDAHFARTAAAPAPLRTDAVRLRVRPERLLCSRFLGFGAQGDYFLTRSFNTRRGVTEEDRRLILERVRAMHPHLIRTFFDYQWWEPEEGQQTPESEAMRDYVAWLRFLESIGTDVLITPWGDYFAYSPWLRDGTSRLPAVAKREAMVRSLVDLLAHLRRRERLTHVRYVSLMNEPDNDPTRAIPVAEYVRLSRLLDRMLRERGLRRDVSLLAVDDCRGGPYEATDWYRQVVAAGLEYCDGISVHTYTHQVVPPLRKWVAERRELARKAPGGLPEKPLLITEFGYGGETFRNFENHKFEYGLFMADFAITALQAGAASALTWCLFDTYYTDNDEHCQRYGLWRYKDEGWEPRPGFYAWSLLTRYTVRGSRILGVECTPEAPSLRAVAMRAPRGALSLLLVNRYAQSLRADVELALRRAARLRIYRYTREAVPTPDRAMIRPVAEVAVRAGQSLSLELPGGSFVLATEVP